MGEARNRFEARSKQKAEAGQGEYERKVKACERRKGSAKGCEITKPDSTPKPSAFAARTTFVPVRAKRRRRLYTDSEGIAWAKVR